jgi:hypothetical protein
MKDDSPANNVSVLSNIMIDNGDKQKKHLYVPGDFLAIIEPQLIEKRVIDRELTPRQKEEYLRYLPCSLCKELICRCK